jgi:hypothetical protein
MNLYILMSQVSVTKLNWFTCEFLTGTFKAPVPPQEKVCMKVSTGCQATYLKRVDL